MTPSARTQAYEALRTMDYSDVAYPGVVRMRGLPFNLSIRMVMEFFGEELGRAIKPGGVVLCEAADGRRNGEVYVEFASEAHATEAQKKDRQTIGSRYIEIFKVPARGRRRPAPAAILRAAPAVGVPGARIRVADGPGSRAAGAQGGHDPVP